MCPYGVSARVTVNHMYMLHVACLHHDYSNIAVHMEHCALTEVLALFSNFFDVGAHISTL